jgi:hypothetical protein
MKRRAFVASGAAAFAAAGLIAARAADNDTVKMPAILENNRFYSYFDYPSASGDKERLLTWVDTGGGTVVVARAIAERLGLKIDTSAPPQQGMLPLDLSAVYVDARRFPVTFAATTATQANVMMPGASSPAFLPAKVLADHIVTFDYPNSALWLDGPPLVDGIPLVVHIAKQTRFPRVELEIDGERMGFLLDTGASFTMLSQTVIDRLRAKHPDWTYVQGAYGPANMIGKGDLASHMLRIPTAKLGPFDITPFEVVSRVGGAFEDRFSRMMTAPIVGSLAGNVLRNLAFRLNYPDEMLEALFTANPWPQAFTMVPLILHARDYGVYEIAGGTASAGIAGAQLLAIDSQPVKVLSLAQVQELLRGEAGQMRAVRVGDQRGEGSVHLRIAKIW